MADARDRSGRVHPPRLASVLATAEGQPAGDLPAAVCAAAAERLHSPGVGLAVGVADDVLESVYATAAALAGERLHRELGEGPGYSAFRGDGPVLVADLTTDDRWPAFGSAAIAAGIRSVFAFPVTSGTVALGTLTLYRRVPGQLGETERNDARLFACLGAGLLVDGDGPCLGDAWGTGTVPTPKLHQATGMVAVQLDVGMGAALSVLRAHAFVTGRSLIDVSADVVSRRLRFGCDA